MECIHCNQSDQVRNKGSRTLKSGDVTIMYICKRCHKTFCDRTGTALYHCQLSKRDAASILSLRSEGIGVRASGRLTGHSHSTVIDLERRLAKSTRKLDKPPPSAFSDTASTSIVEFDEVYTRVHHNCPVEECVGWTSHGIDRETRWQLPSVSGQRNNELFDRLGDDVLPIVLDIPKLTIVSDGERRYAEAVRRDYEARKFLSPPSGHHGKGRIPGTKLVWRIGLQVARKVKGSQYRNNRGRIERPGYLHPDTVPIPNAAIHANHCEAFNAAQRRRCSPMRRRTNMYAKTVEALDRALTVLRQVYNWCRGHFAFKGKETPAMRLGLTDHPWTFTELLLQRA